MSIWNFSSSLAIAWCLVANGLQAQVEPRVEVKSDPAAKAPAKITDYARLKPDFTLTAKEYTAEYAADSEAFLKKYTDKILEISGPVSKISPFNPSYIDEQAELVLSAGGGFGMAKFSCREAFPMALVLPGQSVILRGHLLPGDSGLWQIVKVEGDPPPTFTPAELDKAIKVDGKALQKKLEGFGNHVVLKGKIHSLEVVEDKRIRSIEVVGADDPKIISKCLLDSRIAEAAVKRGLLKVGASVQLLGSCDGPSLDLGACLVILPAEPRAVRKFNTEE